MAEWLDAEKASDYEALAYIWPDAPDASPVVLNAYLGAAKAACIAYAPEPPEGTEPGSIPPEWMLAQAMQARNIYNAGGSPVGGDASAGGFGIASYPLDWHVRQLLRPQHGEGIVL